MVDTKNPILEDSPADTLHNVACILAFLQGVTDAQGMAKQPLARRDWVGLQMVIGAAEHALEYEAQRVRDCTCANTSQRS